MSNLNPVTQTPRPQSGTARSTATADATSSAPAGNMGADQLDTTSAQPSRMMAKLGEFSDKLFYNDYSGKIVSYDPVPWGGLALEMGARPIAPENSLLTNDPYRARTIAKMKAQGQNATWAEVRGVIKPHISGGIGAPVGPVSIGAGAWAEGEIGLSVLSPYPNSFKAPVKAGEDLTVDFPFSAKKATALVEGSEAVMRGRGSVGISGSVSAGQNYQLGAVQVGVSAGVSTSTSKSLDLALKVKRLDGSKVLVSLTRVDGTGEGASVSVSAGLQVPVKENLESHKVPSLGANLIDSQIERWLRLDVGLHYSTSSSDKDVAAYVLDLDSPDGAAAYEQMLRLDMGKAEDLAAKGSTGVRRAHLDEHTEAKGKGADAHLGPLTLLNTTESTALSQGHLEDAKGKMDYQIGTVNRQHEDLVTRWWGGRKSTTREIIETNRQMVGNLYHVRSEVAVDGSTSSDAVRRFLTAAGYVVGDDRVKKAMADDPDLLNRFWRSDRVLDVAIKDDGIQKLFNATPAELHAAYAASYEELDRPWDTSTFLGGTKAWRTTPWLNTTDPHFPEVMQLLAQGPEGASSNGDSNETRDQSYYWITGRSLADDSEAFTEAKSLVSLITSLKNAKTPQERTQLLVKADDKFDLDPLRELGMLTKVAGRENVAVKELALRDRSNGKDLVFESFGLTGDPREQVEQGLAMGGTQAL